MAEYYVVKDKNTGLYFRGKGVNRWGKYYNQASVYRVRANAENTIKEVSWRGEQAEVVPIQIIESTADVVPKSEVERVYYNLQAVLEERAETKQEIVREIFEEIEQWLGDYNGCRVITYEKFAELKKKYTERVCTDCIHFVGCECFSGMTCDQYETEVKNNENQSKT